MRLNRDYFNVSVICVCYIQAQSRRWLQDMFWAATYVKSRFSTIFRGLVLLE
jgi:hypothetical protein